ncbi:MAG: hypothetical protein IKE92_07875 [Clostridiales bacterium]|nr:hypothetical protein [Clostridiales bacterium]
MWSNIPDSTNLKRFDGKCVRIIDSSGDAFDGICFFNSYEYNECEYGRSEDSLQIENFQFYIGSIREVISLEDNDGPYGRFLDPYGKLEEMTVEDGIDSITDILFSEKNEHVIRLLNCLEKHLDPANGPVLQCKNEVMEAFEELLKYNCDKDVQEKIKKLMSGR